ncbi:hypothetical protein PSQ40_05025 [Curvibacter sp. HBC61]|uniref:F5/8 type C domain-containing protein n=1 Tax=Curvibacter cyanobacteriorum TaxID=3026422 RepID=A0ABT5MV54_9BURK|nr:hypothetical protein [Curvibacter sp. HBC61]MDD0837929.1 hypothetical protein [Curvibacter sp. HBC61]
MSNHRTPQNQFVYPLADNDGRSIITSEAIRSVIEVPILAGNSVTSNLDLGNNSLIGIAMPAAWTAAALTIEVSEDGSTWRTAYDSSGVATGVISSPVAGAAYAVDVQALLPWRYVRFRSSTTQAAQRLLEIVTRALA